MVWLTELEKAVPDTNLGALVATNLRRDPNVPAKIRDEFAQSVASAAPPVAPNKAVQTYVESLDSLRQNGLGFDSPANEANRLAAIPFETLVRAVDVAAFSVHNLGVTRDRAEDPQLQRQIARRVAASGGPRIEPSMLRGNIGGLCVWATEPPALTDPDGTRVPPDEMRDRLGLDDPDRFGQGKEMILFLYGSAAVPEGRSYRPTVLDAGWCPVAAAFLPSDPAEPTGMTQHLATGEPSAREAIHQPFPAGELDEIQATDVFTSDPPIAYRGVRLANGGGDP